MTAASSETGYGEAAAYVRSIRQSGHFDSYPALKLLLARQRQSWAEPEPEESREAVNSVRDRTPE